MLTARSCEKFRTVLLLNRTKYPALRVPHLRGRHTLGPYWCSDAPLGAFVLDYSHVPVASSAQSFALFLHKKSFARFLVLADLHRFTGITTC